MSRENRLIEPERTKRAGQADRAWAERFEGATWRKPVGVAAVVLAIGFTVANTYTEEMNHVGVMTPLCLAGIGCLSVAFILLWLGRPRGT